MRAFPLFWKHLVLSRATFYVISGSNNCIFAMSGLLIQRFTSSANHLLMRFFASGFPARWVRMEARLLVRTHLLLSARNGAEANPAVFNNTNIDIHMGRLLSFPFYLRMVFIAVRCNSPDRITRPLPEGPGNGRHFRPAYSNFRILPESRPIMSNNGCADIQGRIP